MRRSELKKWLQENVARYTVTSTATLFGFDVDWSTFTGTFRIKFDERICSEQFHFAIGTTGRAECYFPMFHSPLGVPASYPAVEVSDEVYEAIVEGLNSVLPALK